MTMPIMLLTHLKYMVRYGEINGPRRPQHRQLSSILLLFTRGAAPDGVARQCLGDPEVLIFSS